MSINSIVTEADYLTLNEEDFDPFDEQGAEIIDRIRAAKATSPTFFESIALPLVNRGWRVAPCYPNDKAVHSKLVPRPLEMQSNDPAQIHAWAMAEPSANVCVYAEQREGGLLFLDKDGATNLREKYERETGKPFPKTLLVRSSVIPNTGVSKGHWYFHQTPKTMALPGNIPESKTGGVFSLRVHNQYVTSIGSLHPDTGQPYTIVEDYPVAPMPDDLLDWLLKQVVEEKSAANGDTERRLLTYGQLHGAYVAEAGRLLRSGHHPDKIPELVLDWLHDNVAEGVVIDEKKVLKETKDVAERYERGEAPETNRVVLSSTVPVTASSDTAVIEENSDPIPPFDPSVVNGVYKKFVDVATKGTTMAPQFVYAIAKTIVGARMAGKVKFENLDVEPRFYTALIGETGSGKGEAWRRVFQIVNAEGLIGNVAALKIINSADSGAGIRDAFFEPPEDLPMLMYIDEVESFGNKATATRNPAILDMLIELADTTQISRVKAKKSNKAKAVKTKNDARLCAVMCGQDGHVYMKSFAGRTKLGLWDRLYPEYGVPVEAGDLPHISTEDAFQLLSELNKLDFSGTMTMQPDAKARLGAFWSGQPDAVRKKARWKKNLLLDAYMSAFGRGLKVVESEDVEVAIKIFTRQLVIRQVCFTTEVPDRIGYYLGLLKGITEKMSQRLAAGVPADQVAKSRRDFEKETHAHRDNEAHIFARAWDNYAPTWLAKVEVEKANGQRYAKYLPADDE